MIYGVSKEGSELKVGTMMPTSGEQIETKEIKKNDIDLLLQ